MNLFLELSKSESAKGAHVGTKTNIVGEARLL